MGNLSAWLWAAAHICYVGVYLSFAAESDSLPSPIPIAGEPVSFTPMATTTLNDLSGTITYTVSTSTDEQTFKLRPSNPSATRILFIFTSFNLQQAEMQISEGSGVNLINIFNCASCGSLIPPPFYSTSGDVTLYITGSSGIGFQTSSFELQYVAEAVSLTDALSDISLEMNMGYATFSPQLFNGIMPANYVQSWIVEPPSGNTITFNFGSVSLSAGCVSTVTIYDSLDASGNVIFTGCENKHFEERWLYSTTGEAYVLFENGNQNTTSTFELTYYSDSELYECGSLTAPDVLTDASFIITDGSLSSGDMRRSSFCTWEISPTNASTVTLVMDTVDLKTGATVYVYDGNDASGDILWEGVGPTDVIPPPLTSTTSFLYVDYSSNSQLSDGFTGFKGEFQSNKVGGLGIGSGFSNLKMSTAYDLFPPGSESEYTSNSTYTWYISPTISGEITFVLSSINLPNGASLVIHDGTSTSDTVLATFSGNDVGNTWYTTSSDVATLRFSSPHSADPSSGFRMTYFSDGSNYHCGFPTNPATLTSPSMRITDGSASADPVYESEYCEWTLSPPNSTGVFFFFTRFDLTDATVDIYDGPISTGTLIASFSDTNIVPAAVIIESSTIGVAYTSSSSASGLGFSATYFGLSTAYSGPGDGQINLFSSSMFSLSSGSSSDNLLADSTLTYFITPSSSTGSLYIAMSEFNIMGGSSLEVYDGSSLSDTLAQSYTGNTLSLPYQWLQLSSKDAVVQLESLEGEVRGYFKLSYYSDGPAASCGLTNSMTAPSMIFTDGSSSSETMYADQSCRWVISPSLDSVEKVVLEVLENDVRGGTLIVYDSNDFTGTVLWKCVECTTLPRSIVSSSGHLSVQLTTTQNTQGQGFKMVYWTVSTDAWDAVDASADNSTGGYLLELPENTTMPTTVANGTTSWKLTSDSDASSLSFYPRISSSTTTILNATSGEVFDGRSSSTEFPPIELGEAFSCGSVFMNSDDESKRPFLSKEGDRYSATQIAGSYLYASGSVRQVEHVEGSFDTSLPQDVTSIFESPTVCKYEISTGSTVSMKISITAFSTGSEGQGRLRLYAGRFGYDELLLDTMSSSHVTDYVAPCGEAVLIVEYNSTHPYGPGPVDYGFQISYATNSDDIGGVCVDYVRSLNETDDEGFNLFYIYIALAAAFLLVSIACAVQQYSSRLPSWMYSTPLRGGKPRYTIIQPHPRFTPKMDEFRNRFLPMGTCCVCQNSNLRLFKLTCGHGQCEECLTSYLENALGNIAMFPVKCPMHFEGCDAFCDAHISKRVLNRNQYDKYLEFSDRALYGEGMRCIFCNNYVNFPDNPGNQSMVECPYCIQRFCIRCKKPWHYGDRCPLENIDETLEAWQIDSGAQKCPACQKLIEKDDPDTCNHMVHHITDAIPCIRDRTDFCYLCGEEVQPNYPHDEVRNPGVNHFPDGVFQKCRIIMLREKTAEREQLRKARRANHKRQAGISGGGVIENTGGRNGARNANTGIAIDGWEVDELVEEEHSIDENESIGGREERQSDLTASKVDLYDKEWNAHLASSSALEKYRNPNYDPSNEEKQLLSPMRPQMNTNSLRRLSEEEEKVTTMVSGKSDVPVSSQSQALLDARRPNRKTTQGRGKGGRGSVSNANSSSTTPQGSSRMRSNSGASTSVELSGRRSDTNRKSDTGDNAGGLEMLDAGWGDEAGTSPNTGFSTPNRSLRMNKEFNPDYAGMLSPKSQAALKSRTFAGGKGRGAGGGGGRAVKNPDGPSSPTETIGTSATGVTGSTMATVSNVTQNGQNTGSSNGPGHSNASGVRSDYTSNLSPQSQAALRGRGGGRGSGGHVTGRGSGSAGRGQPPSNT